MDASSSSNSSSPLAVIDPQFCSPHTVQLAFKKKIRGVKRRSFTATDVSSGNVIYETKSPWFSLRGKTTLFDVASGNPLVSIQKKIPNFHGQWQVFRGDSLDPKDLLFTVEKTKIVQNKLNVFLASHTRKDVYDFTVEGNFSARSCTVYKGNSSIVIAQMTKESKTSKKLLRRLSFNLSVDPNIDSAFIFALFVIRDHAHVGRMHKILAGSAIPLTAAVALTITPRWKG